MDIKNLRKQIFINSQYCTYCIESGNTVAAGIMRNVGYKFFEKFDDEKIQILNSVYRKYTSILNIIVILGIFAFIYLFLFPNYLKLMQLPYYLFIILLSAIPLVGLFLIYIVINKFYENFLSKNFGTFEKTQFKPNIYNVEPKAFEQYLTTPRKSSYIATAIILLFMLYIFTPFLISGFNSAGKYTFAENLSNIYLKFVPINPDIYGQKGYAEYNLKKYKMAEKDYQSANLYSFSNVYDNDILGVKILDLSFDDSIKAFDSAIYNAEKDENKYFLMNEKAIYLQQNGKYNEAVKIYNQLINAYESKKDTGFEVDFVYYNRGLIKLKLGEIESGNQDIKISKKMCPDCKFELNSKLVQQP